jgi:hypothetical protein
VKTKPQIEIGATVRIRVLSGETVEGTVVHTWEEKGVKMVRMSSGDRVYNLPAKFLIDSRKP